MKLTDLINENKKQINEISQHPLMKQMEKDLAKAMTTAKKLHKEGKSNPDVWNGTEGNDLSMWLEMVWNAFSTGNTTDRSYKDEIFK